MDWSDIAQGIVLPNLSVETDILLLINLGDLEQMDTIVKALPDYHFSIAAYTYFSDSVVKLTQNINVTIYPCVLPYILEDLKNSCRLFLDVDYGTEVDNIISEMHQRHVPVFAFNTTAKDRSGYSQIFANHNIAEMIEAMKMILTKK